MGNIGNWRGIAVSPTAPKISHVLFADDSLLFAGASEKEALNVIQVLNMYSLHSGQRTNQGLFSAKKSP